VLSLLFLVRRVVEIECGLVLGIVCLLYWSLDRWQVWVYMGLDRRLVYPTGWTDTHVDIYGIALWRSKAVDFLCA
jgi:hypothetical protein